MKSEKIIEVIGLKKSFRNRFNTTNILNGINFTVDKGEFVISIRRPRYSE